MNTKVICVFNNQEIFDKVVKNNENLKNCEIIAFDNSKENIAITKRYNNFIKEKIKLDANNEGFWCAFIHQDFGFMESPNSVFEKLDKRFIYGVVGAKFFNIIHFNRDGFKRFFVKNYGMILQGNNDFNFHEYGQKIKRPKTVNSIDCCCVIVHSSLIRKYNLEFDENLNFHMYAEELCYKAKKTYKIKTKVVQMDCFHMGTGKLDEEFKKSAQYLKEKFKIKRIPSTCPN